MVIENIMYFALGLLAAGLVALVIMPAVWKRAVRLTKRRIEAATPITMAEFRADKDQLRAEFALATRKLEMTIEALRKRMAEQLNEVDSKRTDLGALKTERDQNLAIVQDLESRLEETRARMIELERDSTDMAQRLRMRDRELNVRTGEIESMREALRGELPLGTDLDSRSLTGEYDTDIDLVSTALIIERKRAALLEEQASKLIGLLEGTGRRSAEANAAIAQLRQSLDRKDDKQAEASETLVVAEARLADAESTLNAILAEATVSVDPITGRSEPLLADKLSHEADIDSLRARVKGVEATILSGEDDDDFDAVALRARLKDIATNVSRLVYAAESEEPAPSPAEESLFDRVQRFADDGENVEILPVVKPSAPRRKGRVSDRMAALKEIQGR